MSSAQHRTSTEQVKASQRNPTLLKAIEANKPEKCGKPITSRLSLVSLASLTAIDCIWAESSRLSRTRLRSLQMPPTLPKSIHQLYCCQTVRSIAICEYLWLVCKRFTDSHHFRRSKTIWKHILVQLFNTRMTRMARTVRLLGSQTSDSSDDLY